MDTTTNSQRIEPKRHILTLLLVGLSLLLFFFLLLFSAAGMSSRAQLLITIFNLLATGCLFLLIVVRKTIAVNPHFILTVIFFAVVSFFTSNIRENTLFSLNIVFFVTLIFYLFCRANNYFSASSKKIIIYLFSLIAIVAVVEALSGLFSVALVWQSKGVLSMPRGHFVNRNHFAAFLQLSLYSLLYLQSRQQKKSNSLYWPLTLAIALVISGILFSLSRGGIVALLCSMLFYLFWQKKRNRLLLAVPLLIAGFLLISLGVKPLLKRISKIDSSASAISWRMENIVGCLHIFAENPVFGSGLGSFRFYFPQQAKSDTSQRIARYAHNDYAQYLAETGLFGLFFLVLFLLAIIRLWRYSLFPANRSNLIICCWAGLIGLGLQALVDFVFHLPLLLAIAVIYLAAIRKTATPEVANKKLLPRLLTLFSLAIIFLYSGYFSSYLLKIKDLHSAQPSQEQGSYQQINKFYPFSLTANKQLAYFYYQQQQWKMALTYMQQAKELCPVCADLYTLEGRIDEKLSAYRLAVNAYGKAVEHDPQNANRLADYLLALLSTKGEEEEIKKTIAKMLQLNGRYQQKIISILLEGGLKAEQLRFLFPGQQSIQQDLALELYTQGKYRAAVEILRDTLNTTWNDRLARYLAISLMRSGQAGAALMILEPLLQKATKGEERGLIYQYLAEALAQTKEWDLSRTALKNSCSERPQARKVCRQYIEQLSQLGLGSEIESYLKQRQKATPANSYFHFLLAEYYSRVDRVGEALKEVRLAISKESQNIKYYFFLANLLAKNGLHRAAERELLRAYKISPRRLEILIAVAKELQAQGKIDQAVKLLEEVKAKDPQLLEADSMLKRLKRGKEK